MGAWGQEGSWVARIAAEQGGREGERVCLPLAGLPGWLPRHLQSSAVMSHTSLSHTQHPGWEVCGLK